MDVIYFLVNSLVLLFLASMVFFLTNFTGLAFGDYQVVSLSSGDDPNPAFNFLFRVLSPNAFVILFWLLFSGLEISYNLTNLWVVVPLYIILRLFFNLNRLSIYNWFNFTFSSIGAVIVAYFLVRNLTLKSDIYLPKADDFASEFWILFVLFAYTSFTRFVSKTSGVEERELRYVRTTLDKLRSRYSPLVESGRYDETIVRFIYAIMVVENFNRPAGIRFVERISSCFRQKGTYGIMQVTSEKSLTDFESVKFGIDKVLELHSKVSAVTCEKNPDYPAEYLSESILKRVAWFYNRSDKYAEAVMKVKGDIDKIETQRARPSEEELDKLRLDANYYSEWS